MSHGLLGALSGGPDTLPAVWLDAFGYGCRLLRGGGEPPWLEVPEFIVFLRRLQGLLKLRLVSLPLGDLLRAWVRAHPETVSAMGAKSRPGYALKALLAEAGPRALLAELLDAVGGTYRGMPIALVCPSPGAWARWAGRVVGRDEPGDPEAGAAYAADFLGAAAPEALGGVLVQAGAGREGEDPALLAPLVNLGRHRRWQVGVECDAEGIARAAAVGFDFCVAEAPGRELPTGTIVPPVFWEGEPAPAAGPAGFYFACVPERASPERVLEGLARLTPPEGAGAA